MSKLLIDDKPVMVLPKLAQAIGLNEAIVLQQIHYWLETYKDAEKLDHYQDGYWWVYNSKAEWAANFQWWSESTIWRTLLSLRDLGLLITGEYNQRGYDRTLWYTIDYARLDALEKAFAQNEKMPGICSKWENAFTQNEQMHVVNLSTTIPETNTETNTESKREAQPPLPPDFLPDQFALAVKDIKARTFTRAEWSAILEAEKARGDEARKSLITCAESKLSVNQHPAIQAYREEAHYYPPAEWGPRIIAAVGDNGRLDLWRAVVAAYVGSGWNPRNVKAMLEYFQRAEIPGTTPAAASNTPPPRTPPPRSRADEAFSATIEARLQKLAQEPPKWMQ